MVRHQIPDGTHWLLLPDIIGYATVLALSLLLAADPLALTYERLHATVEAYCLTEVAEQRVPVM